MRQIIPKKFTYHKKGNTILQIHVFKPKQKPNQSKNGTTAILFFFGGGWNGGTPEQFYPQCKYLAERGYCGISAEYRIRSKHNSTVMDSVSDAKAAFMWTKLHAKEIGINPEKILVGGGSAGGHVAQCCSFTGQTNNLPIGIIAFNPVVDFEYFYNREPKKFKREKNFIKELSPTLNIHPVNFPTIIFHGKKDKTVPFKQVKKYTKLMNKEGNKCTLIPFKGLGHGFFNYGRNKNVPFEKSMKIIEKFLVEIK